MKYLIAIVTLAMVTAWSVALALPQTNVVTNISEWLNMPTNISIVTNGVSGNPTDIETPAGVVKFFQVIKPLEFLLIPLVVVLIQLLKRYIPKIPSSAWPWVAPFIGALLDWAVGHTGWVSGNPAIGLMIGGLATWFHQLDRQSTGGIADRAIPQKEA